MAQDLWRKYRDPFKNNTSTYVYRLESYLLTLQALHIDTTLRCFLSSIAAGKIFL